MANESQSQCVKSHFPIRKKANPCCHFIPSGPSIYSAYYNTTLHITCLQRLNLRAGNSAQICILFATAK